MSFLGRVLQGVGSYLVQKGKDDAEDAKSELLFQREQALKQLEFQHDDAQVAAQHENRLGEIAATGAESRRTDLFQGIIGERRDQAKSTRDLQHDITIKGLEFKSAAQLEGLKHKYNLSEEQYKSLLDTQHDIKVNGAKIDRVVFSKNGQMQQVYGDGTVVSRGPTGAYNPGGATGDQSLADLMANSGGDSASGSGGTSGTAASNPPAGIAPAAPSVSGGKAAALAKAGNLYAQAAANPKAMRSQYPGLFDAQGNLLPKDQVIATVSAQFPGAN
jgi:hypothetical protein